ncbi:cytochrome-c peroxidase [Nitrosomonas sp. ANs5]|uniref:cytochrome-c peroxidase n=1 Tax=Nitrosomonas sp. ANs5 TaxID=3423941 RepID=UPI003D35557C
MKNILNKKLMGICTGMLVFGTLFTLDATYSEPATKGSGLPFSEEMAELGDMIFDDENLSINRNQACNACHEAEWGFTGPDSAFNEGGAVYEGSIPGRFGDRKPPSSAYSTLPPVFHLSRQGLFVGGNFWDGRATGEKLGNPAADQAQGPFLNPVEQGLRDSACVVYRVSVADYAGDYIKLWGDNIATIDFPSDIDELCEQEGPPLDINAEDREKIEVEFNNIAIAIAVYEESHNLFSSKFDAMRKGLYKFTKEEQRGFALFQGKGQCARCHTSSGQAPAFTDHTYDNLGVPANPDNPIYSENPDFVDTGLGGFIATRPEWAALAPNEKGKFRVPTLRNVDLRPSPEDVKAYMHNGVFKSIEEVVRFYNTRDVLPTCGDENTRADWGESCWPAPEVAENMNTSELGNLGLSPEEEAAIVSFLKTLSDGYLPDSAE